MMNGSSPAICCSPFSSSEPSKHQWLVRFQNVTHVFDVEKDDLKDELGDSHAAAAAAAAAAVLNYISVKTGWPLNYLSIQSYDYPFVTITARSSILGGKGGFGTLLKGQSKQAGAKRTVDFGACRDLQGRRLRHVNDEIKLRKWRELQQLKSEGKQVDEASLLKTPSGIYNWHLMVPNWASDSLSNKATNKMQRQMQREMNQFKSEEEKKRAIKQEQERIYQQSIVNYAQEGLNTMKSEEDVKSAILQGLQHKKQQKQHERALVGMDDSASLISSDGGDSHEQALVALSGEWVVEQTSKNGTVLQIQSKSEFGTMALVSDRGLDDQADKNSIYMEAVVQTAGLSQIGWADLTEFHPDTSTGEGVGDDGASFSYDGSRQLKFHGGSEEPYGTDMDTWKEGDVIGILYRPSTGEISYGLNGKYLGVAFTTTPNCVLMPAMSCNEQEILELHIHKDTMKYMPEGCVPVGELLSVATLDEQPEDRIDDKKLAPQEKPKSPEPQPKPKKQKATERLAPQELTIEPIDLEAYESASALEELGMDRLKGALMAIGVKCGGSLQERASRLFSLKGLERKDYPMKVRAKNFKI